MCACVRVEGGQCGAAGIKMLKQHVSVSTLHQLNCAGDGVHKRSALRPMYKIT